MAKSDVMGKEKKETMNVFAKGGTNKMIGQGSVEPAQPGVSANKTNGPNNNKFGFQAGGRDPIGKQAADPQAPGVSGHTAGSSQKWGLPPSKGHMAGPSGADPAKPA
jgi:hypothetical protein